MLLGVNKSIGAAAEAGWGLAPLSPVLAKRRRLLEVVVADPSEFVDSSDSAEWIDSDEKLCRAE
jgi:hypothetical protein